MANALYPKWVEALYQGTANTALSGTVKAALVDTGTYTYSSAHDFYDDVSAAVIGTPQTIGSKTYTNGTFDGADVTFSALSGATVEAIVLYIDTGTPATSRLVAYIDTGVTGLPLTPSGTDVNIAWNASGIFSIP
jgi:hypothetical protein